MCGRFIMRCLVASTIAVLPLRCFADISLTSINPSYTQNFNSLVSTGTSSSVPQDWYFSETGPSADSVYVADDGNSTSDATYSYGGGADPADRAYGILRIGILTNTVSMIGAEFVNDAASPIVALEVSYRGEEWRLGFVDPSEPRSDRLDFEYSTTATGLTSAGWTSFDGLDFSSPTTTGTAGAKDGNTTGFHTTVSSTIGGLSIAPSATFWIRWTDFNAIASDDGLAVDDFHITAIYAAVPEPGAFLLGGLVWIVVGALVGGRRLVARLKTRRCE